MINYFHMIRKRLITIGVKPSVARIVALRFEHQIQCRGLHNALDYYKSCGDAVINHLDGNRKVIPFVKV